MENRIEEYNSLIRQYRNQNVKEHLDQFPYIKGLDNWILDYYQVYNHLDRYYMKEHTSRSFHSEMESKYSECVLVLKYSFTIYQLTTQREQDSYQERFDVIKDSNIREEVREYIINQYRKAGYPYGLRIRRVDGGYFIYWDKIQINYLDFTDLSFNYFKELIQNGKEKTEEKIKRLLR